jgi:hypothetical protein
MTMTRTMTRLNTARPPLQPPGIRRAIRTHPILLVGALLGFHVNLGLTVDSGVLPNVIMLPFAMALVAVRWLEIPDRFIKWAALLSIFFLSSALYAVSFRGGGAESVLAPFQFFYSLFLATAVYLELVNWRPEIISRWAFRTGVIILMIGALEVWTPWRLFADWFLQFHNLDAVNTHRDVELFGGYRPRVLTSEPSYAAIGTATALIVWVLTVGRWNAGRLALLVAVSIAGLVIVRSPFIILPAIMLACKLLLWPAASGRTWSTGEQSARLVLVLVGGALSFVLASVILGRVFSTRIESFSPTNDWSVTVRTYGSLLAGWNVALAHPIFGAGVNNFDAVRYELGLTYRNLGVPSYITNSSQLDRSMNHALGAALTFFGFAGTVVYITAWIGMLKSLAPSPPISLIFITYGMTSLAFGALYSPQFVTMSCIIMAGFILGARQRRLMICASVSRMPS